MAVQGYVAAGPAAALAPTIPYVSRHGRGAQRFAG